MNSTNISIADIEEGNFKKHGMPVTVYLCILAVIGIIGNTHALFIYTFRFKHTNCRVFVQWLSSVDLSVCGIMIPFEIFVICRSLTFSLDILCKIFRFFTHTLVISSGVMLAVIAIHRRRKLGNPHGKQFSLKQAHLACFLIFATSGIFSFQTILYYKADQIPTEMSGLFGYQCGIDKSVLTKPYFKMFIGFLAVLTNAIYFVCVVAYAFIIKVIGGQMQYRISRCEIIAKEISSDGKNSKSTSGSISNIDQIGKQDKTLMHSKRISILFLAAATISYIGFMSYIMSIIMQIFDQDYNSSFQSISAVLFRGFYISSAFNPVVYLFLERKFREECVNVYVKMFKIVSCQM